ncbi:hypothetical protein DMC30DRAFT_142162 [Rhodotorula diobovata]|uniref:Uncharacterized protein n=1 Tax=Rhodotorula diobovata TaxID=5288 RepID=A0A5C5FK44_9BASI|nr:hypothetical protein DMC30DRAFT_142162 [Rhodotorula diobovata]
MSTFDWRSLPTPMATVTWRGTRSLRRFRPSRRTAASAMKGDLAPVSGSASTRVCPRGPVATSRSAGKGEGQATPSSSLPSQQLPSSDGYGAASPPSAANEMSSGVSRAVASGPPAEATVRRGSEGGSGGRERGGDWGSRSSVERAHICAVERRSGSSGERCLHWRERARLSGG